MDINNWMLILHALLSIFSHNYGEWESTCSGIDWEEKNDPDYDSRDGEYRDNWRTTRDELLRRQANRLFIARAMGQVPIDLKRVTEIIETSDNVNDELANYFFEFVNYGQFMSKPETKALERFTKLCDVPEFERCPTLKEYYFA